MLRKTKAPASVILWAQFFDDQQIGQGGQLCQLENRLGFNGFRVGGFPWLASGWVASAKWIRWIPKRIQHARIVNPQAFDNESLFSRWSVRWIPPGFPGESACR
jgi:hypothetical protein